MRRIILLFVLFLAAIGQALAQQTPIARSARFTGNINFVATGGSLRTQPNGVDSCAVGASSSQALSTVPAGTTVLAAYLYWGGSGSSVDASVSLNGAPVSASRTFTATFVNGGTSFPYFGGFADVTTLVSGNGSYTFGGLTVNTGAPHCGSAAVAAGWGLIVIYQGAAERLRAINVFDGLQFFRGSALTLTPDGFRVPSSNIDGRMAIVAWEGDPDNSTSLNGFTESLRFNSSPDLNDGIDNTTPASNPLGQPYDGTVNSQGVNNSYGADIDTFDVGAYLSAGATTATSTFSAGGDLVLLTAQIVSVTTDPLVDLTLTKTHSGSFVVGRTGSYTLRVSNAPAAEAEDNVVTVTDTLPAGLTFLSGSGTGWTCSAAGQVVTCTHAPPLPAASALPDLTLNVNVGAAAFPSLINSASVSSLSIDGNPANNSATDATVVLRPDLSTSLKTVLDVNGGEADAGDILRYTITLVETGGAAASSVAVVDDAPANTTGFAVVSIPAGAVNASSGAGTGAYGAGLLNVTGISVPASGTATIVFEVRVSSSATPGTPIDNVASISNPNGPGAAPAAPQLIVSPSQIPSSGSKPLYLRRPAAGSLFLSRTPPAAAEADEAVPGSGTRTWVLNPGLQLATTIAAGSIPVRLWLRRSGSGSSSRTITVTLANTVTGTVGSATQTFTPPTGSPGFYTFTIPNAVARTFPAGSALTLAITQSSPSSASALTHVHANGNPADANYASFPTSRVVLNSNTVINVDSVQGYNAPFPGGSVPVAFAPGATVYVRAVVSDPFGSFDIAGATVTILDPASTVRVSAAAMTLVSDSGAATRSYEYAYVIPAGAPAGGWTLRVIGTEGTEAAVTDLRVGSFVVAIAQPSLLVLKASEVLSDPLNGGSSPKRIPGAIVRYSVTVTNTGPGTADAGSLVITDPLPALAQLYVATGSGSPIEFIDGATPSGLSFTYASAVSYSSQPGGGPPYNYVPTPDGAGFDASVRGVRIAPAGQMSGASAAAQPSFTIRLRIRVP